MKLLNRFDLSNNTHFVTFALLEVAAVLALIFGTAAVNPDLLVPVGVATVVAGIGFNVWVMVAGMRALDQD